MVVGPYIGKGSPRVNCLSTAVLYLGIGCDDSLFLSGPAGCDKEVAAQSGEPQFHVWGVDGLESEIVVAVVQL